MNKNKIPVLEIFIDKAKDMEDLLGQISNPILYSGEFVHCDNNPDDPYTEKYDGLGELFSIESFLHLVKMGCFIDDDGHGNPMKDNMINPSINIYPSSLETPSDATHVCWYNR